jgi:hypothetical protein
MSQMEALRALRQRPDAVCYVRARRPRSLRAAIVYEAMAHWQGEPRVFASTGRIPLTRLEDRGRAALASLQRALLRDGWIPSQEPLVVGEDVIGVYVRPGRQSA